MLDPDVIKEMEKMNEVDTDNLADMIAQVEHEERVKEGRESDWFVVNAFNDIVGGLVDAAEMYGRAGRALPGGERAGVDEGGFGSKVVNWAEKFKTEHPRFDSNPYRRGLSRWVHEGIRSFATSYASRAPAVATGLALGGLPGAIGGFLVSGAPIFGASQYDESKQQAIERGIPEDQAEKHAMLMGAYEGGFEFLSDVLDSIFLGATSIVSKAGEQALKEGVGSMINFGVKDMLKRGAAITAAETSTEWLTGGFQAEEMKRVGIGNTSFWEGANQAFGPAFVASAMFGAMGAAGASKVKLNETLKLADPNASQEERLKVAKQIREKIRPLSNDLANTWYDSAHQAIKNNEMIDLNAPLETNLELDAKIANDTELGERAAKQAIDESGQLGLPFGDEKTAQIIKDGGDLYAQATGEKPITIKEFIGGSVLQEQAEVPRVAPESTVPRGVGMESLTEAFKQLEKEGLVEPWQQSQKDYVEGFYKRATDEKIVGEKGVAMPTGEEIHKGLVKTALEQGKPVPKSVLDEYPDLKKVKPTTPVVNPDKPSEPLPEPWFENKQWIAKGLDEIDIRTKLAQKSLTDTNAFIHSGFYNYDKPVPREGGLLNARRTEEYKTNPEYKKYIDDKIEEVNENIVGMYRTRQILMDTPAAPKGEMVEMSRPPLKKNPGTVHGKLGVDVNDAWYRQSRDKYDDEEYLGNVGIREAMQNSLDAVMMAKAAKQIKRGRIDINVAWEWGGPFGQGTDDKGQPLFETDYAKGFSIMDNGIGMDDKDINDKFLDLHGSGKTNPTGEYRPFGNWGIAKAVILMPHNTARWKLFTRKFYFDHDMTRNEEQIGILEDKSRHRQGTLLEIEADEDIITQDALRFVETTVAPKGVKIYADGKELKNPFARKKATRSTRRLPVVHLDAEIDPNTGLEKHPPLDVDTTLEMSHYNNPPERYERTVIIRLVDPRFGGRLTQTVSKVYESRFKGAMIIDVTTNGRPGRNGYPLADTRMSFKGEAKKEYENFKAKFIADPDYGTPRPTTSTHMIRHRTEWRKTLHKVMGTHGNKVPYEYGRLQDKILEIWNRTGNFYGNTYGQPYTNLNDLELLIDVGYKGYMGGSMFHAKHVLAYEAVARLYSTAANSPVNDFHVFLSKPKPDGSRVEANYNTGSHNIGFNFTIMDKNAVKSPLQYAMYLHGIVCHELTHAHHSDHDKAFASGRETTQQRVAHLLPETLEIAEAALGKTQKDIRTIVKKKVDIREVPTYIDRIIEREKIIEKIIPREQLQFIYDEYTNKELPDEKDLYYPRPKGESRQLGLFGQRVGRSVTEHPGEYVPPRSRSGAEREDTRGDVAVSPRGVEPIPTGATDITGELEGEEYPAAGSPEGVRYLKKVVGEINDILNEIRGDEGETKLAVQQERKRGLVRRIADIVKGDNRYDYVEKGRKGIRGKDAVTEAAEQIATLYASQRPEQTIVTIADAQEWLKANKFRKVAQPGQTESLIKNLLKNRNFQNLSIFDKLRVAAQLERPLRPNDYKATQQIAGNAKTKGLLGSTAGEIKKGAESGIRIADTVVGCDHFCFECYALKGTARGGGRGGRKAGINHQHPISAQLKGVIQTNQTLRIGEKGDPSRNWSHTAEQVNAMLERSRKRGADVTADNVYFVTKLLNLNGFDPTVHKNLQVTLDPFYPDHMFHTMKNLIRLKAAHPDVSISARVRSFHTNNEQLKASMDDAVWFANQFGLPVLETRMRFMRKSSLDLLELDKSKYKRVSNQFKMTEPALQEEAKDYELCDIKGESCPSCKNCIKLTNNRDRMLPIQAKAIEDLGISGIPLPQSQTFDPVGFTPTGKRPRFAMGAAPGTMVERRALSEQTFTNIKAFANHVRSSLKTAGIPEDVAKRIEIEMKPIIDLRGKDVAQTVSDWIKEGTNISQILGATTFKNARATMEISLEQDLDRMEKTAFHEAFHVAAKWILPESEYNRLMKHFKSEEGMADAYADFVKGRIQPVGRVRQIMNKMKRFMQSLGNALRGRGFTHPDDIFGKIMEGEYEATPSETEGTVIKFQKDDTNFKRWFGKSRVVDKNGEPLVMHHGTQSEFNAFDKKFIGKHEPGFFFTSRKATAEEYSVNATDYATRETPKSNVLDVYLSIQKPLSNVSLEDYQKKFLNNLTIEEKKRMRAVKGGSWPKTAFDNNEVTGWDLHSFAQQAAGVGDVIQGKMDNAKYLDRYHQIMKEFGFDGIITEVPSKSGGTELNVIVFDPTQIKSVENRGTFSPTEADIRLKATDEVGKQIRQKIDFGDKPFWERLKDSLSKGNIADTSARLYTKFVMQEYPLARLAKKGGRGVQNLIVNQIRRLRGKGGIVEAILTAQNEALRALEENGITEYSGITKPLKSILSRLTTKEMVQDYEGMRAAERMLSLDEHRPDIKHLDPVWANETIDMLKKKYGDSYEVLQEISQEHRQFEREAILEPLLKSGWMSEKDFNKITKSPESEYYASFLRVMENAERSILGSGKDVIKRIHGSELKLVPSTEGTIANVQRTVKLLETLRLNNMALELNNIEGLEDTFKEVSPQYRKIAGKYGVYKQSTKKENMGDVYITRAMKTFENRYAAEQYAAERPDAYVIKHPDQSYIIPVKPPGAIVVAEEGKKKYYTGPADVMKAMDYYSPEEMSSVVKLLNYPTKLLRAGATLSTEFILRNPARDQMTAFLYSSYGYKPFIGLVKGLYNMYGRTKYYEEMKAAGGEQMYFVSLDRQSTNVTAQNLTGVQKTVSGRLIKTATNPISALQMLSEWMEKGTRVGMYAGAREKGATPVEAMAEAREGTLDFGRIGTQKSLNQIIAFWNANVQGTDKMIREMKDNPARTFKRAIMGITIPSLLLWGINKDKDEYKALPEWQKNFFWIIIPGDGPIIRIPKPFDMGLIFGSLPERILDYMYSKDPESIKSMLTATKQATVPGLIPTAALPLIEHITNYSFFRERQIEPESLKRRSPGLRYTPYTTEIAKGVGRMTNLSPAKLENWVNGWTGGLGRTILQGIDKPFKPKDIPEVSQNWYEVTPFVKGFVAREPIGSASKAVNRFYQYAEEATQAKADLKLLSTKDITGAREFAKENRNKIRFAKSAGKIIRTMANYRKRIERIMNSKTISSTDKRIRIDIINKRISQIATRFNRVYTNVNK